MLSRAATLSRRSMSSVGFIGLGNMGKPMALNLAKAGHSLTVLDCAFPLRVRALLCR